MKNPSKWKVIRWLDTVRNDLDKLDDAILYYRKAVEDGSKHVPILGSLEDLLAETPGLMDFYQGIRTDAQQLRRWLESFTKHQESIKYKWFHYDEQARREYGELKHTEILKYIDADENIATYHELVRLLADCEHHLEDLISSIQNRSYMLSKIADVRKSGMEEVWVDPYKET